jgi:hypothetical protein
MIYTNKELAVEAGFVTVANLVVGMHSVKADGTAGMVTAWKVVPGVSVMYNFVVANDHTFTVGDGQWVVHNCTKAWTNLSKKIKNVIADTISIHLLSFANGNQDNASPLSNHLKLGYLGKRGFVHAL